MIGAVKRNYKKGFSEEVLWLKNVRIARGVWGHTWRMGTETFTITDAHPYHQKRREAPSFTAGMDRRWARRAQCPRAQQYPRSARALNGRRHCMGGGPGIHAGEDVHRPIGKIDHKGAGEYEIAYDPHCPLCRKEQAHDQR
jgi:hypothetical protein